MDSCMLPWFAVRWHFDRPAVSKTEINQDRYIIFPDSSTDPTTFDDPQPTSTLKIDRIGD